MIRVFDAFSGIGGFRSALERVGEFEIVGWCEIDRFAQKAYKALYDTGGEQFYENIRDIDVGKLADFDLLIGGFPCQPFSVCGARKGFADERGDLFFELARLLEAKRPKYFCFENVPGLMGIDSGKTFAKIIETLSQLGYCVEWRVYNSADYLPQVRKRVYIAGCLGIDCSGKILAFGKSDSQNCRKIEQIIGGSQGTRVYDPDGLAVTQCSGSGGMGGKTGLYFIDSNPPPNLTENARCITARQNSGVSHHKGEHSAVFCDLNENPQITENARCLHTRMDLGVTNGTHKGERSGVLIEDGPRAIINPFKETTRQNGRRIKNPNEPMFTLTVTDRHGIVHHGRIRRLMPIEAWRLQGFTTEQFEKVAATGMSDAQLYKQAGNAVSVPVVEEIARNLLKFDEEIN
ncbi:MAG: DNA (cytosine-5-)-methyltransferase [Ruminococcus sp.]|uniref:DNA (cytosine-5-)-methyltransferase n=1 Tax=Ruminococcus sp. RTP21204st1_B2_RTP21204_210225 TaxID=3141602 RepID=UPI0034A34EC1